MNWNGHSRCFQLAVLTPCLRSSQHQQAAYIRFVLKHYYNHTRTTAGRTLFANSN